MRCHRTCLWSHRGLFLCCNVAKVTRRLSPSLSRPGVGDESGFSHSGQTSSRSPCRLKCPTSARLYPELFTLIFGCRFSSGDLLLIIGPSQHSTNAVLSHYCTSSLAASPSREPHMLLTGMCSAPTASASDRLPIISTSAIRCKTNTLTASLCRCANV